jgi:hypothetical protein
MGPISTIGADGPSSSVGIWLRFTGTDGKLTATSAIPSELALVSRICTYIWRRLVWRSTFGPSRIMTS